jgi:hypothetical protein
MLIVKDSATLAGVAAIDTAVASGVIRTYRSAGAHNPTGGTLTLTVHLVPAGGVADNSNRIINRAVPAGKTDLCPELVGRGLNAGGILQAGGAGLNFGYTAVDTITG